MQKCMHKNKFKQDVEAFASNDFTLGQCCEILRQIGYHWNRWFAELMQAYYKAMPKTQKRFQFAGSEQLLAQSKERICLHQQPQISNQAGYLSSQ